MNHKDIIKRAWKLLWSYKLLWVFGIILALTTTSSSNRIMEFSSPGQGQEQPITIDPGADIRDQVDDALRELEHIYVDVIPEEVIAAATTIGLVLACLVLVFLIVRAILRHVSDAALLKLVDDHEQTGEKRSLREGIRMGWSRTAWRLFLVNLIINLPAAIAFILYMLFALLPLFLWSTENVAAGVIGSVSAIGLFFIGILGAIIVGTLLSLLKQFFRRACALEDLGVIASLRRGFSLVRENWKDVGLMWLLMIGLNLGYALAIIPVVFLVLVVAAVFGGGIFVTIAWITGLITGGGLFGEELSIIIGLIAGIPTFFLLVLLPLGFLGGLLETFISTIWTLSYRELLALEELGSGLELDPLDEELPDPED
jgi:hypothetical protein